MNEAKKYIAHFKGQNSGIVTRQEAEKWAATVLGRQGDGKAYIAEIILTVTTTVPAVQCTPFVPEMKRFVPEEDFAA